MAFQRFVWEHSNILTFRIQLIINALKKVTKKSLKKVTKKDTPY